MLRRILRALVVKKRAGNDRQRWQMGDLLFISVLGETGRRGINLAHFSDDGSGDGRAALRVVDWDEDDAHFHMLRTIDELRCLRWPDKPSRSRGLARNLVSGVPAEARPGGEDAANSRPRWPDWRSYPRARVNAAMEIESRSAR